MNFVTRFRKRLRGESSGAYVCTLCGLTFEDRGPVLCPECRGLVVARDG